MKQPTATHTCPACGATCNHSTTTICTGCRTKIERALGDIGALALEAQRIYRTDDHADDGGTRARGTDDRPLVASRRRRTVLDPQTCEPRPEPFRAGEYGRAPSMPWDADHGLGRDIDISLARQAAIGRREGARSSGRPLPYSTQASKVAHEAQLRLGHWVRVLHDGVEVWPVGDVAASARWLLARTARLAAHPSVGEFERDVSRVVTAIRHAIDRPADRWYAGPCDTDGCVEEHLTFDDDGRPLREARATTLYADPELQVVTCPRCRAEYDVGPRRAWLLAAAEDQLAHAELIGRAAPALGVEITPSAVRNYAARGRVVAHGTDWRGRPLYRVGDVIDVARDVLARKAEAREVAARRQDKSSRRSA